jgi:hypothetical protein
MSDPVNMVLFVKELSRRSKAKAAVVLTHEYNGQKEWAEELAKQTDTKHINLIYLFTEEPTLSSKIEQFSVQHLFDYLKNKSRAPVLIISGMEFLKATWTSQPKAAQEFASRVQTWNHSPSLLFILQYDKLIATYDFGNRYRQYTFVVDQRETLAL